LEPWPLVIAGKAGWLYEPILRRIAELNLQNWIHLTGFFPDDDLPALYNAATLLAMPSRYEGFGLPVLEAMACGTPVVCSNTSSLPEVAGDAALLVPPENVQGWAEAIARLCNDNALHARMRERGLAQAAHFTWENAARQTADVYRHIAGQTAGKASQRVI
jgi:glycosyltransferase involved in cell wall biosynthesis